MPEFFRRPQLPNALANQLVQLMAQQEDPMARGFEELGGIFETAGATYAGLQKEKRDVQVKESERTRDEKLKKQMAHLKYAREMAKIGKPWGTPEQMKAASEKQKELDARFRQAEAELKFAREEGRGTVPGDFTAGDASAMLAQPAPGAYGPEQILDLPPTGYPMAPPKKKPLKTHLVTLEDAKSIPGLKAGESIPSTYIASYRRLQQSVKKQGKMSPEIRMEVNNLAGKNMEYKAALESGDYATASSMYPVLVEQAKRNILERKGGKKEKGGQEELDKILRL